MLFIPTLEDGSITAAMMYILENGLQNDAFEDEDDTAFNDSNNMPDEKPEWEPLLDSRPSLPYILFAAVIGAAIMLVTWVVLHRLLVE